MVLPMRSGPGAIGRKGNLNQREAIPETFLGVSYTRDRAGLPLEAVRIPVPRLAADDALIRVAASSLNSLVRFRGPLQGRPRRCL